MIRVAHVITGLGVGGAEMMLAKLVSSLDRQRFQSSVVALNSDLALADRIRTSGTEVTSLNVSRAALGAILAVPRLAASFSTQKVDLVQTWMYHADLVGGLAARMVGLPVIWNVQTSASDLDGLGQKTQRIVRMCGRASRLVPSWIVSCSHVAVDVHAGLRYEVGKFRVIPNGTDLSRFRPDTEEREAFRAEIGVRPDEPLLGLVARFHPMKDHDLLLEVTRRVAETHPRVRLALCGLGLDSSNQILTARIAELGLERRVILLGMRSDTPRVLNGLDIHVLSSAHSEGFPNVLGEAMATGVRCVVTDVGDCRLIVGDTGLVVPPRQAEALTDAVRQLLDMTQEEAAAMSRRTRERVARDFSLGSSVAAYEELYEQVVTSR